MQKCNSYIEKLNDNVTFFLKYGDLVEEEKMSFKVLMEKFSLPYDFYTGNQVKN